MSLWKFSKNTFLIKTYAVGAFLYRPNSIPLSHMNMKMRSTQCVFLLILVLVEALYCQGCWHNEREALLALNAQFPAPLFWEDGPDCCQWVGVKCNSTTRRVAKLDLSPPSNYYYDDPWHLNYTSFIVFEDLKSLSLASNGIAYCVENEGHAFNFIQVLYPAHYYFEAWKWIWHDMSLLTSLYLCTLQGWD